VELDVVTVIRQAAQEFGVDANLLLSQAYAESKFDRTAVSSAGAMGLLQIMPLTWAEWSAKIGAGGDPFDARQNARVGAAYLKWLLAQTQGNVTGALIAYGFGIGNWLNGKPVPDAWANYAAKIVHGRDLLKAVGL
jgi:soluble lytic murein transglycosylase-like protein